MNLRSTEQALLDERNRTSVEYSQRLIECHAYGRSENDIRTAFRDFVIRTNVIADESDIRTEAPPGTDSVKRVDLIVRNTYVEFKRNLIVSGQIDPAYTRQLDEYLLEAVQSGFGIQNGILTDGKHYLKRSIGDHILPVPQSRMFVFDQPGQGPVLREYLNDIIDTDAQDIVPSRATLTKHLGIDSDLLKQATALLKSAHDQHRDDPTVAVKRKLWQELLQVALGQDSTGDPDAADWLYIRHTYLTTLLAIVTQAHFGGSGGIDILHEADNAPEALLNGATLSLRTGLKGVIESDLFQWPTEIGATQHIAAIARKVAQFDWTHQADELAAILYQNTITPEERRRMGEYYTPRWLAQTITDELIDQPTSTVTMDPACGSGTFIECLVRNIIAAQQGKPPAETLNKLQQNIIGIDLHPVAVQLAKATWVLNSSGVIADARASNLPPAGITPPIYLGDSLQLRYDDKTLFNHKTIRLRTTEQDPDAATDAPCPIYFEIPLSLALHPDRFDLLMLDLAQAVDAGADTDRILEAHGLEAGFERDTMQQTAAQMRKLHTVGRNHVWAYYLRNMVRPAVITEQRVDAIIGNPPWLTYNKSADIVREELDNLSKNAYDIWAGGRNAANQEVAVLFFSRVVDLYLRDGGKIGMVLPHSVLRSGQHLKWRSGCWQTQNGGNETSVSVDFHAKTPWDLDNLEPNDFFPMPGSVVFAQSRPKNSDLDKKKKHAVPLAPGKVEIWRGPTNTADVTRHAEALHHDDGKFHSPYEAHARRGADVFDRRLFFVTTRPNPGPLAVPNTHLTYPRIANLDKKTYNVDILQDTPVHGDNLFHVHLGETIAPYVTLQPLTATLPVDKKTMIMPLDHSQCEENPKTGKTRHNACTLDTFDLDPRIQDRWRRMSDLWDANKGKTDTRSLYQNLNWLNKLSSQLAWMRDHGSRPVRIAYTGTGRPTAALIADDKAILDTQLYQVTCVNAAEAHYLLAIINSDSLADAVKPFCTTNWARKIRALHKHVWKLPIPAFDRSNPIHDELSSLGKRAASEATKVICDLAASETRDAAPFPPRRLTADRARAALRHDWQPASPTAQAIERSVSRLLAAV